ncbi:MAG: T9SS type A sorting domain-containing protein [Bacteroidia bacterium]|jgi:hypothetical protein|nr:T9SS type A sorting domain-containing protein [Bacteroidia bacterium]
MKKLVLLIGLLSGISGLNAQFYQREYGTATSVEELTDGVHATVGTVGQIMTGQRFTAATIQLTLTRTNLAGSSVGAGLFNRNYQLNDPAGNQLNAQSVKVLQLPNGVISVVGNYYDATGFNNGVFVAGFNAAGAPLGVAGFQTAPTISAGMWAESACLAAPATNTIYITGHSTESNINPGNGSGPFVMAVNFTTLTLVWGQLYDFGHINSPSRRLPRDIIYSPYSPAGANELVVVGTNRYNGIDEGFLFRVDATNGNPITGTSETYDLGTNEEFFSISVASGFGGGSNGFVIGGHVTGPNGTLDHLLVKVDQTGVNLWASAYEYSAVVADNIGADVIQRRNSFGFWEYYLTGNIFNSPITGTDDIVVMRIDDNGFPLAEYTYNGTDGERSAEIVLVTAATVGGYVVFGTRSSAADANELAIKSYFNGVTPTACPVSSSLPGNSFLGVNQQTVSLFNFGSIIFISRNIANAGVMGEPSTCFANTVPGGSNARIAQEADATEANVDLTLYPNPLAAGTPLQVQLTAPQAGEVRFTLHDITGREVFVKTIIAAEGTAQYEIQFPSQLVSGVYSMSISGAGINRSQRLVIE